MKSNETSELGTLNLLLLVRLDAQMAEARRYAPANYLSRVSARLIARSVEPWTCDAGIFLENLRTTQDEQQGRQEEEHAAESV